VSKPDKHDWIDPNSLAETQGAVEGFITNRHGEIDGVLLAGARQTPLLVCTPPHMAAEIEAAVKIGDTISVRGIRPRRADIIAAAALTTSNGEMIIDNGPGDEDDNETRHRGGEPSRMDAEGVVRLSLFGPKGELRGAVLEDGTVVRIGPKEAVSLAELLCLGSSIAVRGTGLQTKHGRVITAEEVGPDRRDLRPAKASKHKDKPKHKDKSKHKKYQDEEPTYSDASST
jgi:hypothetical protein